MTIGTAIARVQNEFYYNMVFRYLNYGTNENPINLSFWLAYCEMTNLRGFMVFISDVLMDYYENEEIDAATIAAVLEGFRNLEDGEKSTFYMFGMNIYYDMIFDYFVAGGTASEELVRAFLHTEIGYVEYSTNPSDQGRVEYFDNLVKDARLKYNSLSEEEKAAIDPILKELYDYYVEKHNLILDY